MAEERMLNDEILLGLIKANSGGGGGGTTDYDDLNNKPQIGGVTLSGNKSASDLGLATTTDLAGKQDTLTFDSVPTDGSTNPVESNGVYDALALKQDKTDNTLQTTSKTVVGAVNELKSGLINVNSDITNLKLNNFSMDSNDIKDYNTSANKYTFKTDGYLCATPTNDDIIVNIFGSFNNYVMLAPRLNNNSAVYVRKGMRCYVATNTGSNPVYFVGLI